MIALGQHPEDIIVHTNGTREFRAFGRAVKVRQQGRLFQVLGIYRTTEHGTYHDARREALARLVRAEEDSRHMAATNCDGLLFSMEGL